MQRGGNANQRILLQNLSAIEIVKIINDYVSMSLYYVNNGWYLRNAEFLDIIEANILTVFFCSVMLISAERVACVMLNLKYFTYVSKSLVQNTVFTTWIVGSTSGLFLWATGCKNIKVYYYLIFDILTILLIVFTYVCILGVYRTSKRTLSNGRSNSKNMKIFRVPVLIITTFLLCNGIPDVVFAFDHSDGPYRVMVVMWGLGFLLDPCIYIFLGKKTRKCAKEILCGRNSHTRRRAIRVNKRFDDETGVGD